MNLGVIAGVIGTVISVGVGTRSASRTSALRKSSPRRTRTTVSQFTANIAFSLWSACGMPRPPTASALLANLCLHLFDTNSGHDRVFLTGVIEYEQRDSEGHSEIGYLAHIRDVDPRDPEFNRQYTCTGDGFTRKDQNVAQALDDYLAEFRGR